MKKLTLDLETLRVETFSTEPERKLQRGTVQGHASLEAWCTDEQELPTAKIEECYGPTIICQTDGCGGGSVYYGCGPQPTQYDQSCNGTCGGGTCFDPVCVPF